MNEASEQIAAICRDTDVGLWHAYDRIGVPGPYPPDMGRLLFPQYHGQQAGTWRVSEQEARFSFGESLCRGLYWYSAEAPTSKLYRFTGLTPLSGQTDLAVFDADGRRICNVEFRAKGLSPSAKTHFPVFKDMQKLLREPVWGLWFHLLSSTNNSTIVGLLKVIAREMARVHSEYSGDIGAPGLTIHICVLKHGFSLHRDVETLRGGGLRPAAVER